MVCNWLQQRKLAMAHWHYAQFAAETKWTFVSHTFVDIRMEWPGAMWPDLAIFCTLGIFLKALAKINLPKSPTFLGNICEGVKINHFSSEIIFVQLL